MQSAPNGTVMDVVPRDNSLDLHGQQFESRYIENGLALEQVCLTMTVMYANKRRAMSPCRMFLFTASTQF